MGFSKGFGGGASKHSMGASGHGDDLLITPLLDLFVALIPFLIISVVLTKINVVDVSIAKPVAGQASASDGFDLVLRVSDARAEILLHGKVQGTIEASKNGVWIESVRKKLVEIKKAHPDEYKIRIEPKGSAQLDLIMGFMDAARKLKTEDGDLTRKDEQGHIVKLQYLFPNVILRGVYGS